MSTATKSILALVAAVVIGAAIWGGYQYPVSITNFGASSPAGSSFTDAKIVEVSLTTATDTVFSMLNSDAGDRVITSADVYLSGGAATTSQYSVTCGTSTVASGVPASTSYILATTLNSTLGTSTGTVGLYIASSSPGITGTTTSPVSPLQSYNNYGRVWKTGTYLNCKAVDNTSGANALNTFDSGTTGYFGFRYFPQ